MQHSDRVCCLQHMPMPACFLNQPSFQYCSSCRSISVILRQQFFRQWLQSTCCSRASLQLAHSRCAPGNVVVFFRSNTILTSRSESMFDSNLWNNITVTIVHRLWRSPTYTYLSTGLKTGPDECQRSVCIDTHVSVTDVKTNTSTNISVPMGKMTCEVDVRRWQT